MQLAQCALGFGSPCGTHGDLDVYDAVSATKIGLLSAFIHARSLPSRLVFRQGVADLFKGVSFFISPFLCGGPSLIIFLLSPRSETLYGYLGPDG